MERRGKCHVRQLGLTGFLDGLLSVAILVLLVLLVVVFRFVSGIVGVGEVAITFTFILISSCPFWRPGDNLDVAAVISFFGKSLTRYFDFVVLEM